MVSGAMSLPSRWQDSRTEASCSPASICVVPLVVLVLVSACAGSVDEGAAGDVPVDPELVAADEARVEEAVLRAGDVPEGWRSEGVPQAGEPSADDVLGGCEAVAVASGRGETAFAESPRFVSRVGEVSSTVSFYVDESAAMAAFEARFDAEGRRCVEQAVAEGVEASIREDSEIVAGMPFELSTEVGDLSVKAVGDQRRAVSVRVEVVVAGVATPAVADAVVVRVGRAVVDYTFMGPIGGVDDVRDRILAAGAERARAALAS